MNPSKDIAQDADRRIVLVTGPAGSGRSTAIRALEDIGFETIDNLPLTLLPRLLDGRALDRPLALGIDTRNRDFSVEAMLGALDALNDDSAYDGQLLYLDAREDVLVRRYSETRRRHPFAEDDAPAAGVARELAILGPVRSRADILLDTSELTPHELRAQLAGWFAGDAAPGMTVSVQSFSYKRGLPQELDCAFDVRFLANPHWVAALRPLTGQDPRVVSHITSDPGFAPFYERLTAFLETVLPAYRAEGKSHLAIGVGCTGGQHRSVAVAEKLANTLADQGWQVSIRHRELERRPSGAALVDGDDDK